MELEGNKRSGCMRKITKGEMGKDVRGFIFPSTLFVHKKVLPSAQIPILLIALTGRPRKFIAAVPINSLAQAHDRPNEVCIAVGIQQKRAGKRGDCIG